MGPQPEWTVLPLSGHESRTVQPVASRSTDCAIRLRVNDTSETVWKQTDVA